MSKKFPEGQIESLLRHAHCHVPFYRDRLNLAGMNVRDRCDYERFSQLPVVSKAEIQKAPQKPSYFVADNVDRSQLIIESTSGSSGTPLECCKTRNEQLKLALRTWEVRRWFDPMVIGKPAITVCPRWFPGSLKTKDFNISVNNLSEENLEALCEEAKRFKPRWMFGTPSAIYKLARFLDVNRNFLDGLNLSFIEFQGEYLPSDYRSLIQEVFRCDVSIQYGCVELWVMAYSCRQGSLHIIEDDVFIEIVDDHFVPVKDGDVGTVVVTSFSIRSFPFIRYLLGDRARLLPGMCPCGRTSRRLELTGSRAHQLLLTDDGRIFDGLIFHQILQKVCNGPIFRFVRNYKVIQNDKRTLSFYLDIGNEPTPRVSQFQHDLREEIRSKIAPNLTVNFFPYPDIAITEKLWFFKSEVAV